jgi:competence protein ComEA
MARVRELIAGIVSRARESVWFSLLPKAAFGLFALAALGLLGSGALDDYVPTKSALAPAQAAPAVRPSSRATASASASTPPSASAPIPPAPSASASGPPRTLVVLNTATEAELTKLPGVGPKKAQAILKLREKLGGRFKRIEDLMRVRGLKRKALEKIRPLVVLDAEDEAKKGTATQ